MDKVLVDLFISYSTIINDVEVTASSVTECTAILLGSYGGTSADVVSGVKKTDYNDTVYNLVFREPTKVIVEGFVLGDFELQCGTARPGLFA